MVDCRVCKNHYMIYSNEINGPGDEKKYICMAKEIFIDKEYITKGPCDFYVDVDSYDTEE